MKFSNSLKFNAVAEWWDEYIAYSALKKQIYLLEKSQTPRFTHDDVHDRDDLEAHERSALIGGDSPTDRVFRHLLDLELKKVCDFYMVQEQKELEELSELEKLVKLKDEESFSGADRQYMNTGGDFDDDDEDEDEDTRMRGNSRSRERHSTRGSLGRRRTKSDARPYGTAPALSQSQSLPGDTRTAVNRRYSVSSSEDNLDLEASLASLSQIPENGELPSANSHGRGASSSPRTGRPTISSIFNFVKPGGSISSSILVPDTIWTAKTNYAFDTQVLFKRRIATLYNTFTSLRAYVELNYSGFRKILKKYDKTTDNELKDEFMHNVVEQAYPFLQTSRERLEDAINRLILLYAKCVTRDDISAAKRQLKMHQREHIAWERDTVWRQMIGQERHGQTDDGQAKALGGHIETEDNAILAVGTPVGRLRLTRKHIALVVALVVFVTLLNVQVVAGAAANNCLAILIFSTIMWATEAIPLFVTSMLVPLLLVVLRVFISDEFSEDGNRIRLDPPHATTYVFRQMFSPTIMLLIGGFTIASAISKTNIDRVLVTRVLSLAGTRPNIVLLSFMGVSCFASMWISNVAAPTLCFSLIKPILRNLPPKSSFAPCLIIGIALAANIGGQSSPISSPQNLIALQFMDDELDWGQWFAVALPVSAVSIILIWLLLLVSYRPSYTLDGEVLEIKEIRASKDSFTFKQYWVSFVCLATIVLWLIEKRIESVIGDMGVIAIIPIVAFFSTGVLRKDDFEQFLWTIVFLAMGGIALGKGVTSSGLLELFDEGIRHAIEGLSLPVVVMVLSAVVLVVSTFISHTIAAVLLVPIAREVGTSFPGGDYQRLLIFLTALLCSTGMGMPVSGFPNQTAANQEDDIGQLYLTNIDFLKNGVPASIIAAFVVATLGYALCLAIHI